MHQRKRKTMSKTTGKRVVMVATEGRLHMKKYEDGRLVDEWPNINIPVSRAMYPGVRIYMDRAIAWACEYNPPDFSEARRKTASKRRGWLSELLGSKKEAA